MDIDQDLTYIARSLVNMVINRTEKRGVYPSEVVGYGVNLLIKADNYGLNELKID
jgi:hypothetical protein